MLTFVERQGGDSEKWRKYAGQPVIPAWVADADYTAADPIITALHERVEHGVFGYAAAPAELNDIVCAYCRRQWDWPVQPEWIVYSPGIGAAIHNSCRMAEGGGLLTPAPIYHVFRTAPAIAGAARLDMPMHYADDCWQLPAESWAAALAAGSGKIFQLCNPHNPNGKVYSKAELLAIGEFCCRHDLLIFSDEVHADLILDDNERHIPIAALAPEIAERTVTMQSPSKAYNTAGLNLSFIIIGNEQLRARYRQAALGKVLNHLNPFGYAAAAAAYSGACDDWLQAQRVHLRANRDRLQQAVDGIAGIEMRHLPSTYLAWLNVRALNLPDAPAHFIRHGLGMSPGADFGDADYMRLNFACSPQRLDEIIACLSRAAAAA